MHIVMIFALTLIPMWQCTCNHCNVIMQYASHDKHICTVLLIISNRYLKQCNRNAMQCTTMFIISIVIQIHCTTMFIISNLNPMHCTTVLILSNVIQMHCTTMLIMSNLIPIHCTTVLILSNVSKCIAQLCLS